MGKEKNKKRIIIIGTGPAGPAASFEIVKIRKMILKIKIEKWIIKQERQVFI